MQKKILFAQHNEKVFKERGCCIGPGSRYTSRQMAILEMNPGRDGHARVAKVQCGGKTWVRPIHKHVLLELQ